MFTNSELIVLMHIALNQATTYEQRKNIISNALELVDLLPL